jgi:hypothetical protein
MPSVTPNRTDHGRHNVAFLGGSADPFATPAAVEKSHRRKKRKLINQAREVVHEPNLHVAASRMVMLKRRWERVGSAGSEYERGLRKQFEQACDELRNRIRATRKTEPGGAKRSLGGRS